MLAALPMLVLLLAAGCARSRSRTWAQFSPLIHPIEIAPLPDLSLGAARDVILEQEPDDSSCVHTGDDPVCATCGFSHHLEN